LIFVVKSFIPIANKIIPKTFLSILIPWLPNIFFIGRKMRYAHDENPGSSWYENVDKLIEGLRKLSFKNSDILIKGSRSLQLENSLNIIRQISV